MTIGSLDRINLGFQHTIFEKGSWNNRTECVNVKLISFRVNETMVTKKSKKVLSSKKGREYKKNWL